MAEAQCLICEYVRSTDRILVRDAHWSILTSPNPGTLVVAVNEHRQWTWGLTDAEAAALGPVITRASRAVREACDAARVYLIGMGENELHFHFMLVPRLKDDEGLALQGGILAGLKASAEKAVSAGTASSYAERLRAAFGRQASPTGSGSA